MKAGIASIQTVIVKVFLGAAKIKNSQTNKAVIKNAVVVLRSIIRTVGKLPDLGLWGLLN